MKRDPNDSERDYDTDNEPNDEGYESGESETGRSTSHESEGANQRTRSKPASRGTTGPSATGGKGSSSTRGKRSTQRSSHRTSR